MALQFPQINWNMLTQMGDSVAELGPIMRERQLRNEMQTAINPDGTYDYGKMIGVLSKYNPVAAANAASEAESLKALTGYRDAQASVAAANVVPDDIKVIDEAVKRGWIADPGGNSSNSATPQYLSPAEPELPAAVAEKVYSIDKKKYLEKSGTNKAENEQKALIKEEAARNLEATLQDMYKQVQSFDDYSVENALGPWQGDTESMWGYNPRTIAAQNVGAVMNAIPGLGGKESTYEVRSSIAANTTALANALKPFAKAGGAEGQWTNYDQQKLESIVGELAQSRNKEEFGRRFQRAISRINAAWNLNINPKVAMQTIDGSPKIADRYSNPEVPETEGDKAEAAEAASTIPGATRDPRGPYTGPAPEGTIISNGKNRLIKQGGQWVPIQ